MKGMAMSQKFLSIKNFEKYQSFTGKNPPWFKIHKSMFGDREFIKLSTHSRYLYVGLIHLAVESGNKIYNDSTWIGQRLYIPTTEVKLTPLYRAGFLTTSNLYRTLSESESERESESETEERQSENPSSQKVVELKAGKRAIREDDSPTDKHRAFAQQLKIDVGPEWGKFKNYCLAHDKRYADFQAAFRNWIAKAAEMKGERRVL